MHRNCSFDLLNDSIYRIVFGELEFPIKAPAQEAMFFASKRGGKSKKHPRHSSLKEDRESSSVRHGDKSIP
jgi:hypothetical protein